MHYNSQEHHCHLWGCWVSHDGWCTTSLCWQLTRMISWYHSKWLKATRELETGALLCVLSILPALTFAAPPPPPLPHTQKAIPAVCPNTTHVQGPSKIVRTIALLYAWQASMVHAAEVTAGMPLVLNLTHQSYWVLLQTLEVALKDFTGCVTPGQLHSRACIP